MRTQRALQGVVYGIVLITSGCATSRPEPASIAAPGSQISPEPPEVKELVSRSDTADSPPPKPVPPPPPPPPPQLSSPPALGIQPQQPAPEMPLSQPTPPPSPPSKKKKSAPQPPRSTSSDTTDSAPPTPIPPPTHSVPPPPQPPSTPALGSLSPQPAPDMPLSQPTRPPSSSSEQKKPVPQPPRPTSEELAKTQAQRIVDLGKKQFEKNQYVEALATLDKVPPDVAPAHEQAQQLISTMEARRKESQIAYQQALDHYVERRYDQALAAFGKVQPYTPKEYQEAKIKIQDLKDRTQPPPTIPSPAEKPNAATPKIGDYLGVLRATNTDGDGREFSGSLVQGQEKAYSFRIESPGYGDLEVLVEKGFSVEGSSLSLTGVKCFEESDKCFARYAREKVPSGTDVTFKLANKKNQEPAFECFIYLYPR